MIQMLVYEDGKFLFKYESPMNVSVGECIEFERIRYRIINKIYVVNESLFELNKLGCVNLDVIEIEK